MSNAKHRLEVILKKIEFIESICEEDGSITTALKEDPISN